MLRVQDASIDEKNKYDEIWQLEEYKKFSPGLQNVPRFLEVMNPDIGSSIVDVGCGEGVAGLEFQKLGMDVWWVDISDAGLSADVPREKFIQAPLWSSWRKRSRWAYGFCCDVLEHIPTEYALLVADRIVSACGIVWFQISLRPDQMGQMIGEPLHLTVRPYDWWLIRLSAVAKIIEARDLCGTGLYVVRR